MKSVFSLGSVLGIICFAAAALLAVVNAMTSDRIQAQADAELRQSLQEVMADGVRFEPVSANGQILYYKVTASDGRVVGAAFKASAKGYSSRIDTIVGMKPDGTINAVKIVSQQETPGLGSRITEIADTLSLWEFFRGKRRQAGSRPWFQAQFDGKAVSEIATVQAITGATISSQAVIDSVKHKAEHIQAVLRNE